ncbi:unnamed protein product [Heterosigma akashiwo]
MAVLALAVLGLVLPDRHPAPPQPTPVSPSGTTLPTKGGGSTRSGGGSSSFLLLLQSVASSLRPSRVVMRVEGWVEWAMVPENEEEDKKKTCCSCDEGAVGTKKQEKTVSHKSVEEEVECIAAAGKTAAPFPSTIYSYHSSSSNQQQKQFIELLDDLRFMW